ncbi:MAG: hypothetical protein JWL59_1542 [Chthoniobacteraceae bacterium]|nr:hypothetical protein [Chthoniobacteraceae bacterium]
MVYPGLFPSAILAEFYRFAWLLSARIGSANRVMGETLVEGEARLADLRDAGQRAVWLAGRIRQRCQDNPPAPLTTPRLIREGDEAADELEVLQIEAYIVAQHFQRLPEPERSALALFYLNILAPAQIGELLELDLEHLAETLERARTLLQSSLGTPPFPIAAPRSSGAQNAMRLLPCYRKGEESDKRVRKAVHLAEADSMLGEMLAAQIRFDEQISRVIHSIEPPKNLREQLLAETPAPATPSLRSQLLHPAMLPVVAGLLIILGFLVWLELDRRASFPGRESVEKMVSVARDMSGVELEPTRALAGDLGDSFYMRGFEGFRLPPELARMQAAGTRVFKQNGRPIAQLALDPHNALLYVFHPADFGVDSGRKKRWKIITREGWVAAIRESKGVCTVIAFRGERSEMELFLKNLTP